MRQKQQGYLLPIAIFILVSLAGIGVYMLQISSVDLHNSTLDIQSDRAYQRARGVMEYGFYQIRSTPPASGLPSCPTFSSALPASDGLKAGTVTLTCSSSDYTENGGLDNIRVYQLTSNTNSGTANTLDYVERQLEATISRCIDASNNEC